MKLEVLLATMNQKNDAFLDDMAIATDILVCNQNENKIDYKSYYREGHKVRWYDFSEKGVGLNRNNAILRAEGDICILADDDVTYLPNYEETIVKAFLAHPNADVILFNIYSTEGINRFIIPKIMKIGRHNCGKFGAVRIAFRRNRVIKNAICFNQLFGGGSMFAPGEDTMFLRDCIRKGLKVIAVPDYILKLRDERPSTWFCGYNQKYFEDMGAAFCFHFRNLAFPCLALQLFRRRKTMLKNFSYLEALRYTKIGIKRFREL